MKRYAALAVLVAAAILAASGSAGNYTPPPGDCCPQWSPRGTQIVLTTSRGGSGPTVAVGAPSGGPDQLVSGIPVGVRSPDWKYVAFCASGELSVARVDGTDTHPLSEACTAFTWSPDSKRIAFVSDGALDVANADGSERTTIAHGLSPAWSPQGHLIAYSTGRVLHVVRTDGSADAVVEPGARVDVSPVWSPDGTRLAYWSSNGLTALLKVVRIGGNGGSVRFEIPGAATNGAIVWAPDGNAIYGAGSRGLVRIDLATGKRHTLVGIPNGVFSPDGRLIAYTSGGECRDRVGVYVADADGKNRRRLTNSCRVYGTDGPDTLHGSFSQVVLGLGGDDTLYADDTYYFFDGNTLYGGDGNDRLFGGFGQDDLYGGKGDDVLDGGPSSDVLVGGPGRDRIFGGGGGDTIFAVDGRRDTISCGKNAYDRRDRVYADRIDLVAGDCELVHRR